MSSVIESARRTEEHHLSVGAATHILQRALAPDCSLPQLAECVEGDPAFAIRVLSVVNSVAFGLTCQVGDVRRAVGLLGVRGLRNLALGFVVTSLVPRDDLGEKLLGQALRRAAASRAVAQAMGARRADEAFTVGLLLECGVMSLAHSQPELAREVIEAPAAHRALREKALGRQPHFVAGAAMMAELGLPSEICEAIAHHHDTEPPRDRLGRAVWLGERLAGLFEGGNLAVERAKLREAALRVGLTGEQLDLLLEELPGLVEAGAAAYQWRIGDQDSLESMIRDASRALVDMNIQYEATVRALEAVIEEKEALARELAAANASLAALAATDELTGLANKRALLESMSRELAQADRQSTPLSLVFMDVDHFKHFNDEWGHATGDEVLRMVGKLLKASLRQGDLPARYGGEEFVLVLPHTDEAGAGLLAERVRVALEAQVVAGPDGPLSVTASCGVATTRGPGCKDGVASLLNRADEALYRAKENGRNRVEIAKEVKAA